MCFGDILGKLESQMSVRILYWFGCRFGVPFGSLLESFLGSLGSLGHPLGSLWAAFGSFGCLFQHFSLLLGAFGHPGVFFVSICVSIGCLWGDLGPLWENSSDIPWLFLRHSLDIP